MITSVKYGLLAKMVGYIATSADPASRYGVPRSCRESCGSFSIPERCLLLSD
jgi:hypothetical protein